MSKLRHSLPTILATLLALGTVEGLAWWWMHPATADTGEPLLAYRTSRSVGVSPTDHSPTFTPLPDIYRQAAPMLRCTAGEVFHVQIHDTVSLHGAFFEWDGTDTGSVLEAFRHMPEACMGSIGMKLVSKEQPIFYQVGLDRRLVRQSLDDDGADSLVAGGDGPPGRPTCRQRREVQMTHDRAERERIDSGARGGDSGSEIWDRGSEILDEWPPTSSSTDHRSLLTMEQSDMEALDASRNPASNHSSTLHADRKKSASHGKNREGWSGFGQERSDVGRRPEPGKGAGRVNHAQPVPTNQTLVFDHTVFRDPGQAAGPLGPGPLVHAFRAVWVSGTPAADARSGLSGRGFDQLRTIRLNSALTRYRPRHARVIQGAVRGMHTPEAAWAVFEEHILRHLTYER